MCIYFTSLHEKLDISRFTIVECQFKRLHQRGAWISFSFHWMRRHGRSWKTVEDFVQVVKWRFYRTDHWNKRIMHLVYLFYQVEEFHRRVYSRTKIGNLIRKLLGNLLRNLPLKCFGIESRPVLHSGNFNFVNIFTRTYTEIYSGNCPCLFTNQRFKFDWCFLF